MPKKILNEDDIRLMYLFRDKLVKELYDMNKNDYITKGDLIQSVYQKLTNFISVLDGKRLK